MGLPSCLSWCLFWVLAFGSISLGCTTESTANPKPATTSTTPVAPRGSSSTDESLDSTGAAIAYFAPGRRLTSVGSEPVRVNVSNGNRAVATEISKHVVLREGGASAPFTTRIDAVSESQYEIVIMATKTPKTWFELTLDIAAGDTWTLSPLGKDGDRPRVIQLHPDSSPAWSEISLCPKADRYFGLLTLSENVDSAKLKGLKAELDGVTCAITTDPGMLGKDGASASVVNLVVSCPGAKSTSRLVLTLDAFSPRADYEVKALSSRFEVPNAKLGDGCAYWYL